MGLPVQSCGEDTTAVRRAVTSGLFPHAAMRQADGPSPPPKSSRQWGASIGLLLHYVLRVVQGRTRSARLDSRCRSTPLQCWQIRSRGLSCLTRWCTPRVIMHAQRPSLIPSGCRSWRLTSLPVKSDNAGTKLAGAHGTKSRTVINTVELVLDMMLCTHGRVYARRRLTCRRLMREHQIIVRTSSIVQLRLVGRRIACRKFHTV